MKRKVGVVADDITGANDIGIMFGKSGYSAAVYPYREDIDLAGADSVDVVIIDTNSRFDDANTAYRKVYNATKKLMDIPCSMYHKKTCSVFRGNIGPEFDAMQDALGVECSMVVLGFPENGRTTIGGIHYVHGVKLENSQFRNDPIHPMRESNLIDILSKQTSKKVGSIDYSIIDGGVLNLKREVERLKKKDNYIIFDVRDQEDLKVIADAIKDERNICGSSAIGEELPRVWHKSDELIPDRKIHHIADKNGTLVVAGSLTPQTISQVEYLRSKGFPCFELKTEDVFNEKILKEQVEAIKKSCISEIEKENDILIHTSNSVPSVTRTKAIGYEAGYTDESIGKIISGALADIVLEIQRRTSLKKIVVAGGDTSASISGALGIKRMVIIDEIEPGVPDMYGYNDSDEFLMVLKSGSFGSDSFLYRAVECLKSLQKKY